MKASDIQGLKYLNSLDKLLALLRGTGTERDRAHNRELFFDQYAGLLLLYFYTPVLTSLRGIQQASNLKKVQKTLGCSRSSLGSLSEASQVFDPERLKSIITELSSQAQPFASDSREAQALKDLRAFDGTLLPALKRMAWALWLDEEHRAGKLHLVFEVARWLPENASVTEGNGSEKAQLRGLIEPGRLYTADRAMAEYALFQEIIDRGSSFIIRLKDNTVWEVLEERRLSAEAKAASIEQDLVVRLGGRHSGTVLKQALRLIRVRLSSGDSLLLATDRMDLDADLVALGYRYRWSIELFFRWFKCILGCRHLLSHSQNGVTIQVYVALIASLLVTLWTGRKPNKRTFEMICFYFSGWADHDELLEHIRALPLSGQ